MTLKTFKPYTKSTRSNHLHLEKNLFPEEIIWDELPLEEEDQDINKNFVK